MIIKSVKLKNIRSYKDTTEIEIPEGKTLFIGDIGSGKSTILQAIEFALFGTGTSNESLKGSSLLRRGETSGFVELKLLIDDKEIIIRRTLKKAKNTIKQDNGYIIINGVKKILSPSELKYHVLKLLNYPEELVKKSKSPLYRFTVYTPQEQMKHIFSISDEERKETFRKLFQIEKYKRIRDNSIILKQLLKEKKEYIEGFISDIEEKEETLNSKRFKINEIEKELKEINDELNNYKNQEKSLSDKIKFLEEKRNELMNLEKELSKVNSLIEHKANEIAKIKQENERIKYEIDKINNEICSINYSEKRKEELNLKLKELNNEINRYRIKLNETKNLLSIVNEKLEKIKEYKEELKKFENEKIALKEGLDKSPSKIKEEINKIEEKLKELNDEKIELERRVFSNNKKINELKETIEKINELKVCPLCLQEVNEKHKEKIKIDNSQKIELLEKDNAQLKEKISKLQEAIKDSDNRIKTLRKEYEEAILKIEKLKNIEEHVKRLRESINDELKLRNKKENLEKELDELNAFNLEEKTQEMLNVEKEIQRLNEIEKKIIILNERKRRLKDNKERIINLKDEIKQLNTIKLNLSDKKDVIENNIKELKPIEEQYIKIKEKISELNSKTSMLKRLKEEITREIVGLEKEIKEKKETAKKLEIINKMLNWISDIFNPMIENIEKHLFARVYYRFNDLFKKWLSKLIDEENMKVDLDISFAPKIIQNGYDASINDLSGGEKTSIALAYRLALNQVINDLMSEIKTKDIIILDEPTDGFSSEQMDKVREILNELNIRQIILVSHESKIESFVDNRFRIYKENNISRVIREQ